MKFFNNSEKPKIKSFKNLNLENLNINTIKETYESERNIINRNSTNYNNILCNSYYNEKDNINNTTRDLNNEYFNDTEQNEENKTNKFCKYKNFNKIYERINNKIENMSKAFSNLKQNILNTSVNYDVNKNKNNSIIENILPEKNISILDYEKSNFLNENKKDFTEENIKLDFSIQNISPNNEFSKEKIYLIKNEENQNLFGNIIDIKNSFENLKIFHCVGFEINKKNSKKIFLEFSNFYFEIFNNKNNSPKKTPCIPDKENLLILTTENISIMNQNFDLKLMTNNSNNISISKGDSIFFASNLYYKDFPKKNPCDELNIITKEFILNEETEKNNILLIKEQKDSEINNNLLKPKNFYEKYIKYSNCFLNDVIKRDRKQSIYSDEVIPKNLEEKDLNKTHLNFIPSHNIDDIIKLDSGNKNKFKKSQSIISNKNCLNEKISKRENNTYGKSPNLNYIKNNIGKILSTDKNIKEKNMYTSFKNLKEKNFNNKNYKPEILNDQISKATDINLYKKLSCFYNQQRIYKKYLAMSSMNKKSLYDIYRGNSINDFRNYSMLNKWGGQNE